MEAVPRLPMIAFELKTSPEYVDFGPVLKQVYLKINILCSHFVIVNRPVKVDCNHTNRPTFPLNFDVILS